MSTFLVLVGGGALGCSDHPIRAIDPDTPTPSAVSTPTLTPSETPTHAEDGTPSSMPGTQTPTAIHTPTASPLSPTDIPLENPCGPGPVREDAACIRVMGEALYVDGVVIEALPEGDENPWPDFAYMKVWFQGVDSAQLRVAEFDNGSGSTQVNNLGTLLPTAKGNATVTATKELVEVVPVDPTQEYGLGLDITGFDSLGTGWALGDSVPGVAFEHVVDWYLDCAIFGEEPCETWPVSVSMFFIDEGSSLNYQVYVDPRIAEACAIRFYDQGIVIRDIHAACDEIAFQIEALSDNDNLSIAERYPALQEWDAGESRTLARYTFTGVAGYDLTLE